MNEPAVGLPAERGITVVEYLFVTALVGVFTAIGAHFLGGNAARISLTFPSFSFTQQSQ